MNCISKFFVKYELWMIFLVALIFTIIYSFVSINKHNQFQTFGWDTAVFDQQLYFIKDFKVPYTSLVKINGLGDHFQVTFLILGFIFYRIYSHPNMLFIMQSLIACLSIVPLYLIAKLLLSKSNLPKIGLIIISFLICFAYLLSVSFQAMMFDEFHNEPLVTLPLLWMMYFLISKNNLGFWISWIVVLMTKEIYGLFGVPLAFYIFFTQKDWKKAIIVGLSGILVFYLLIYQIMPYLAGKSSYQHFAPGNRPQDVVSKLILDPRLVVLEFINYPKKIETIFTGFFSFGFLPLLSPINLLLPFFSLSIRFFDDTTPRLWEFNNHYAAPFIPFLAIAGTFGVSKFVNFLQIKKINKGLKWKIISTYLFLIIILQSFLFHSPLNSVFKKSFFYKSSWQKDAHELINQVPKNISISTQNSLISHLSQRDNFYLFPELGDAKYIALDLSPGPNKFAPLSSEIEASASTYTLINKKKFKIIWQKNKAILLEKI